MASIWSYWGQRHLQGTLTSIDPELLDRLEVVIPRLEGDEFDPTQLYLKENLVRLVAAFTPSTAFKKRDYMRTCLNRLPPDVLERLSSKTGVGVTATSFDERVEAFARHGWNEERYTRTFLGFFGLSDHFMPEDRTPPPSHRDFFPPSPERPAEVYAPYKPLKDYQTGVFFEARKRIEPPRARLIVQMPTGAGKTRTSMELITRFLDESPKGTAVVWLAHSEELCEQAFQCFGEVWSHVARSELRAYRAWGKHGVPALDERSAFVVAGFQKLYAALDGDPEPLQNLRRRVGLIVIDEAHKSIAPTYEEVIRSLRGDDTRIVGLTATPGRTHDEESEELAAFYFNTLVGIDAPRNTSVIRLLKDLRVLAQADYAPLVTDLTFELTTSERRHLERMLDFPPGFLKRLGAHDVRNIEILKRLLKECEARRRVLLFACSVAQSQFITAILLYFGVAAAHVDGSTSKGRRREVIEGFRHGDIQVLCNYGVLSTGFDAPNTDVVFIARPTASPVLYSQMIGRGLRGPAIGGTERCKLIDVRDNIEGFGDQERVYDLFEEYFD